jgi:hypothetical protein
MRHQPTPRSSQCPNHSAHTPRVTHLLKRTLASSDNVLAIGDMLQKVVAAKIDQA